MTQSISSKSFAILRIVFGFVWLIDAWFKWQSVFLNNFISYLVEGAQGQPVAIHAWINFWIHLVSTDPYLFAVIVAIAETSLAIGMIFGLFTRLVIIGGITLAFIIWSTAEGLGGPYVAGSTDIGASVIYIFVFIALWIGRSWRHYSIDNIIYKHNPKLMNKLFGTW